MNFKKIYLLILLLFFTLVGCNNDKTPDGPICTDPKIEVTISVSKDEYYVGDSIILDLEISDIKELNNIYLEIVSENNNAEIVRNVITPVTSGSIIVVAKHNLYKTVYSNELVINIKPSIYLTDPYENVNVDEFYSDYEESINKLDSYYRSLHGLMSGSLTLPDEAPLVAKYQPKEEDTFIRNTCAYYSLDKDAYYIVDGYGEIVDVIFEGGGYISLDEVASHLLAFGNTPGNHVDKKSVRPSESIWKGYLRVNNTAFSGSTTKYPYEPMLPNISGCGGDLYYYEVDFGTTGTTCDPSYDIVPYNNGSKITRGAARLVYTRYDKNRNEIIDINEKYVFYTYNHYNDFQEYLNYQGGWGEMFGNITGGGTLSSKSDYNPTSYVEVIRKDFSIPFVEDELNEGTEVIYYKKDEEQIDEENYYC